MRVYEAKLEELGIPHEELNLRPLVAAHLGVPQHHVMALNAAAAAAEASGAGAAGAGAGAAAGAGATPNIANAIQARNAALTAAEAIAQATIHTAPADLIV